jgi:hypothetical protein
MDSPIESRIAEALRELAEMPDLPFRAVQKKHGIPRSTESAANQRASLLIRGIRPETAKKVHCQQQ